MVFCSKLDSTAALMRDRDCGFELCLDFKAEKVRAYRTPFTARTFGIPRIT